MRRLASSFARSLAYFMQERTPNDVAVKLKMSPNTIRNWLRLSSPTANNPGSFPQIDTLDAVAKELKCEVWHLLHPDIRGLMADMERLGKTKEIWSPDQEPLEHIDEVDRPPQMQTPLVRRRKMVSR
jgi:hypothetical protein